MGKYVVDLIRNPISDILAPVGTKRISCLNSER